MQLTILTQYYPPEIGAAPTRLSDLAKRFIDAGHQVTVLTAMPNYPLGEYYDGYGGLLKREQQNGADVICTFVYPVQEARFLPRMANYMSFLASSALLGSLTLHRSDYILVQSPPMFVGLSGIWLSCIKGTRLILNISDLWPESGVSVGAFSKDSFQYKVGTRLERFLYRRAWLITGQSKSILDSISLRYPDRYTYHLSNGVDTEMFSPQHASVSERQMLVSQDKCSVSYIGHHGLAQGLDQIIRVAQQLQNENVHFTLIGDGPVKAELRNQVRALGLTNVTFVAALPKESIPPLVASSDIALVPLKAYIPGAVPSKLYEAMASGVPVILIAEGEAADIVQRFYAGFTVKPGDIDGLRIAIKTLLEQPLLRAEMGDNGRRAVVNHFDRKTITADFIKFLEQKA